MANLNNIDISQISYAPDLLEFPTTMGPDTIRMCFPCWMLHGGGLAAQNVSIGWTHRYSEYNAILLGEIRCLLLYPHNTKHTAWKWG